MKTKVIEKVADIPDKRARNKRRASGFTLIEFLLVMAIIGLLVAVIVPRAQRARIDAEFAEVRQSGSEIAANIMTWAETQARNQPAILNYTTKDFLNSDIYLPELDFTNLKLSSKYTGNQAFAGVKKLLPPGRRPRNPFNLVDYFAAVNDDQVAREDSFAPAPDVSSAETTVVPSKKPGLLYLAVLPDPVDENYLNFYLLYTAKVSVDAETGSWYGEMSHKDINGLRHGIFVARLYDEQEDGALAANLADWRRKNQGPR